MSIGLFVFALMKDISNGNPMPCKEFWECCIDTSKSSDDVGGDEVIWREEINGVGGLWRVDLFASMSHQDWVTPKGLSHMQKMNICNF